MNEARKGLNTQIRWGILGTAEIAREQVMPAFQKCANAKLKGIASRSGNTAELATEFNIPKEYSSYEELLEDPDIDAVYVPLPNHLHAQWVKKAAARGKHVLCEKPAALTAQETKEMIEICEKNNVYFMESMMYQFHPQHKKVKELVESGVIGDVKLMRASFTFQLEKMEDNFRLLPWSKGGGSVYDIGCYCIHALRSILGEPTEVSYCSTDNSLSNDSDIAAMAVMEFDQHIKGYFDCGMNMSTRNEYEIVGTGGVIRVSKAFIPQEDGEGVIHISTLNGLSTEEKIYDNYYVSGLEYFSECIINNTKPIYGKSETINNVQVIEDCLEKAKISVSSRL